MALERAVRTLMAFSLVPNQGRDSSMAEPPSTISVPGLEVAAEEDVEVVGGKSGLDDGEALLLGLAGQVFANDGGVGFAGWSMAKRVTSSSAKTS